MSQELANVENRLIELVNQKEDEELNVMKLKCEIRELKHKFAKLKKEQAEQDIINKRAEHVLVDEPIEQIIVEKKKPANKKKAPKNTN